MSLQYIFLKSWFIFDIQNKKLNTLLTKIDSAKSIWHSLCVSKIKNNRFGYMKKFIESDRQ